MIEHLAILFLAAYSLAWNIAVEDGPFEAFHHLRLWVDRRFGTNSWQSAGIHCPICTGFWASLALFFVPPLWVIWLAAHGLIIITQRIISR